MDEAAKVLTSGASGILAYDNIAIVVLFTCLLASGAVNFWILRWVFKFLFDFKTVLSGLTEQIVKLNERIDHV